MVPSISDPTPTAAGERYRTLLEINNAIISSLTSEALFRAVAQALRRVIRFDRSAIYLHDPAKDVLRLYAREASVPSPYFVVGRLELPVEGTHVGWVFLNRRPLLRRDLEAERRYPTEEYLARDGVRSLLVVPLLARGEAIGTLNVASITTRGEYSDADAEFLQEVASQVALAVENMKAYEEITALNQRVAASAERSRTLLAINNAIMSNLTRDALFHAIAQALRRVVACDRIAIFLHDPEKDVLRLFVLEATLPSDYFVVGLEMASKESHVGWVFQNGRPLLRRDLEKERQYALEDRALADGVRSYIIVPLLARRHPLGVLALASTRTNQYADADAEFLQEVAGQVALAVENMSAYEEIAALKARLERENVYLQEEIRREHHFEEIVGSSPALLEVLRKVERVAPTDATVLVVGETGTGKELIAHAIHTRSARKDRPLVKVNCGAIPAGLVESELFGHVKGAFTGALERRVGRFELADRGTLFLDEVGELPAEMQVKLLRVLQEQEFEPVGSSQTVRVDVRVIAATGRDLEEGMRAGRFRSDLFYRLNVFPLRVPPLRERPGDVPQLVMFFLDRFSRKLGKRIESVSRETLEFLARYPWPGNVRELQNVIERGVVLSQGPVLTLDHDLLPATPADPGAEPSAALGETPPRVPPIPEPPPSGPALGEARSLEEVERRHILAVLAQTGGVIEGPHGAARVLNLHPNTLRSRMKKHGILPTRFRSPTSS